MQGERKRVPIAGRVRAYRQRPSDFRKTYIAIGWQGIDAHYRTNWRVIRRWIEEEGREGLIVERAAAVERQRRKARLRDWALDSGYG